MNRKAVSGDDNVIFFKAYSLKRPSNFGNLRMDE